MTTNRPQVDALKRALLDAIEGHDLRDIFQALDELRPSLEAIAPEAARLAKERQAQVETLGQAA